MANVHTPGPWTASHAYVAMHGGWQDFKIAGPDGKSVCSCSSNSKRSPPEIYANASLVAAAPDMLAALQGFQAAWDSDRLLTSDEAAAIRAAIAKALGDAA